MDAWAPVVSDVRLAIGIHAEVYVAHLEVLLVNASVSMNKVEQT
jgi:hypothetical protein